MGDNRLFDLAFVLSDCNGDVVAAQRRIDSLLGYCNSALNRAVKERDTLRAQLTRLESANAVLRGVFAEIKSEIERGKNKDCIGCINGSDMPFETLCRSCDRIWVGDKMYLLWDWRATEARLAKAGQGEE